MYKSLVKNKNFITKKYLKMIVNLLSNSVFSNRIFYFDIKIQIKKPFYVKKWPQNNSCKS